MTINSILPLIMTFMMNTLSISQPSEGISQMGLKIVQDGKEFSIQKMEETIQLTRGKFELVFNLKQDDDVAEKYYSARVVADVDGDIFKQFEAGESFSKVPSLSEGTSMAGPKDKPYDCIFFDDQAHHYIFYSSEEEKRAHLKSKEPQHLQLGFEIENYCMQDFEINISNSNFEKIYLVFLIDKNLNEQLEEGEFVKLEISFSED